MENYKDNWNMRINELTHIKDNLNDAQTMDFNNIIEELREFVNIANKMQRIKDKVV